MYIAALFGGILLGTIVFLVQWMHKRHTYWTNKGVPHRKPWPLIGNLPLRQIIPLRLYYDLYNEFSNAKFVGVYEFMTPKLLIRDPELVNAVLIKEFTSFMDRMTSLDMEGSPVDSGLSTLTGAKWRALRSKLTVTFSSGKLKMMLGQMRASADNLIAHLSAAEADVETRDLMFVFSTDIIATCAFGLDATQMHSPDSEFRRMARKNIELPASRMLKLLVLSMLPKLGKFLKFSFTSQDVAEYFADIIRKTFEFRRKNKIVRNDFVQLLLELEDKGSVEWTSIDPDDQYLLENKVTPPTESLELTETILISQAFLFLSAGSEPIANTMMFTAYHLSRNLKVQEIARREVNSTIFKHGGLTYAALKDLPYLEQCIQEAMRLYPINTALIRECTKSCTLDGDLVIDKGTTVVIPVLALHNDPRYFPDPGSFKPERFGPGHTIQKGTYLAFGDGPRMCIAMRFAMVEMKLGLASLLHKFKILPSPKTKEMKVKSTIFTVPDGDVFLTYIPDHPDFCTLCPSAQELMSKTLT